ncbi:MAG: DegT/DnrJ/EryC1/StrS family aminotransferase [Muribaculaceae bacterium]|nr:DegT/DnrJ/EryC1/StrS family aminotransferase [Muribaculaceae bacterium]MDE6631526.1 DegT/DnrJ/EryC1/StrS family aminotransferase [Muribaculaceae bacterium]
MDNRILLRMCKMSGHEMPFIQEAFDGEWVVPLGPNVTGFEKDLESFLCTDKKVVALSSGTSALHLGLLGLGVEAGDEVMVQSMTFSASVNPVRYVGAIPVMVDSEPVSWNMDPELLDFAIADRIKLTGRKPKAIVLVCLYGMPANYDKIMAVAEKWQMPVLEDAAEAFGSSYANKKCGTFGRFGVLSFNGNKMITTSGGGALVCPDEEAARKAMYYATQARLGYAYYQHEEIGYNYRMSNISAGIGRGQMMVAEEYIAHHRHRQAYYREHLSDVEGIVLHENPDSKYDSNFWLCTVLIDPSLKVEGEEEAYSAAVTSTVGGAGGVTGKVDSVHTDCEPNANVEAIRLGLSALGIETRPLWKPMHKQPVFSGFPSYVNGVSEDLFHRGLCLPSGPYVTDKDADRVIDAIKSLIV